ncbi:hypothetical protein K9L97_02740 [Candidatus Woesearchaeota archaeon]|nr:hypothetical protein [Candidatus Woesearchaeota archaeon]
MLIVFVLLCFGILISLYVAYFDFRKNDFGFKPFCDFSYNISCSNVFLSSYGSLFGVKNYVVGLFFYSFIFVMSFFSFYLVAFLVSVFGVLFSFYLAYLLFFRVRTYCVVCFISYVINLFICLFLYLEVFVYAAM